MTKLLANFRQNIKFILSLVATAGVIVSAAYAGNTYVYDDLGRLVQVTYNTGQVTKFAYDPAGNRRTVTVQNTNVPPTAIDDSVSTNEDTPIEFNPRSNDTDPNNDPLTISNVTAGLNGNAVVTSDKLRIIYTPNANYNGSDVIQYTINDGRGGTATGNVNITIIPVNDPPNAVNDTKSTNEDTAITFDPRLNDTDLETPNTSLTITAKTNGQHGSVAIVGAGTQLKYTPNANFNGQDTFTYTISDGTLTDTATVTMNVIAVNDAPNAVTDSLVTLYQTAKSITVTLNDTDVENDPLTITAKTNGGKGIVTITDSINGVVKYTPNAGATGPDSFTYTISDGNGGTDVGTVNVTIGDPPLNQPPIVQDETLVIDEFQQGVVFPLANDSDPENDPLTIASWTSSSANISVSYDAAQKKFTITGFSAGLYSVDYMVSDGHDAEHGGPVQGTVTVDVRPGNPCGPLGC